MKKAKVMLMAIGIFAVVGGALAFKAKKIDGGFYCTTTAAGAFCTQPNNGNLKTTSSGGTQYYYTLITGTSCPSNQACQANSTSFLSE